MGTPHTVIVCLPAGTPRQDVLAQATSILASHRFTHAGAMPHFTITGRRAQALIQPWKGTAAGGPIRLLDLAGMRTRARHAADTRWQIWRQAVAGTPNARPFWHYAQRHHDQPDRYPRQRAQQDYLSQPRVLAMTAHNAVPGQPCPLPTEQLEALQAGAQAYTTLGWLQAVPADAVCTTTDWWTPATARLTDVTAYLHHTNRHLDHTHRDAVLLALALPIA
ncbi:MAG TPA: hypothetical protein VGP31_11005 [Planosporangium sp.]|nr:hypothetical protein [Planosporangium sp.]